MKAATIGVTELRRMVRDRANLFFVFVFPMVLILLIGAAFGGDFTPKLGVLVEDDGRFSDELMSTLRADDSIDVVIVSERTELLEDVERGIFEAGLVVEDGYSETLESGGTANITYVTQPGEFGAAIRTSVDGAVGAQSGIVRAARIAQLETEASFDEGLMTASRAGSLAPTSSVSYRTAGEPLDYDSDNRFGGGASTQLILFTFVNSLAGSAGLIQTRGYGVLTRMLGTPTSALSILAGETFGRFLVAGLQGTYIIAASSLLFGVQWGDPLAAAAILVVFALVSTGAAMVAGSVLRTEQQAGALVPFGLALAALGGSMIPLEVFSERMLTLARFTPHAWANEAFSELRSHDAGVGDVLPHIAVLALFAAVLLGAGGFLLRRKLTR